MFQFQTERAAVIAFVRADRLRRQVVPRLQPVQQGERRLAFGFAIGFRRRDSQRQPVPVLRQGVTQMRQPGLFAHAFAIQLCFRVRAAGMRVIGPLLAPKRMIRPNPRFDVDRVEQQILIARPTPQAL